MDEFTLKHFDKWLTWQFNEDLADIVRQPMIEEFSSDVELWGNRSYFELYEHLRRTNPTFEAAVHAYYTAI